MFSDIFRGFDSVGPRVKGLGFKGLWFTGLGFRVLVKGLGFRVCG